MFIAQTKIFRQFAFRYGLPLLLAAVAAIPSAQGQFVVLAQDEDTVTELGNGSTVAFESEGVGDSVTIRVSVSYQGPDRSTATIDVPDLAGSRTFEFRADRPLPGDIAPGRTVDFDVTFTPTGTGPFSSRFTLNLTQNELGKQPVPMNVVLNLSGVVADYTVSFQLLGEGNETLVGDGGVFEFQRQSSTRPPQRQPSSRTVAAGQEPCATLCSAGKTSLLCQASRCSQLMS